MEACGGRAEQQAVDACSRRIPGPRAGSRRPPLFPLSSLSSSIDWSCKGACPLLSFPASLFPLSIRTAGALRAGVYAVRARFPARARDFPPARNPSPFPRVRFPFSHARAGRRRPFFPRSSPSARVASARTPWRRHRPEGRGGRDAPIGSSPGRLGVA